MRFCRIGKSSFLKDSNRLLMYSYYSADRYRPASSLRTALRCAASARALSCARSRRDHLPFGRAAICVASVHCITLLPSRSGMRLFQSRDLQPTHASGRQQVLMDAANVAETHRLNRRGLVAIIASSLSLATHQLPSHASLPPLAAAWDAAHSAAMEQPSLRGTLLRLAFHDCITHDDGEGGSNGSVRQELDWSGNRHLYVAVDALNAIREASHLYDVSFADLVAVAGAAAVHAAGGPLIPLTEIGIGRADATVADPRHVRRPRNAARCPPSPTECRGRVDSTLPSPGLSTDGLVAFFARLSFPPAEAVALCGAHTLGRHASLLGVSKDCLRAPMLTTACIESGVRLPFIASDPDRFSNSYFKSLLRWEARQLTQNEAAFLPTDVTMTLTPQLRNHVVRYAKDEQAFFQTFARAYVRLVRIGVKRQLRRPFV